MRRRTLLGILVIIAAMLSAGCAETVAAQKPATPGVMAERPTLMTGDTWTFSGKGRGGGYTYQATVIQEGVFEGVTAYEIQSGRYLTWRSKNLGFVARLRDGKVVRRMTPPSDWAWPLSVGKTWSRAVTWEDTERGLQRFTYTDDWKVEGYGEIEVPAGTFRAFKVARRVRNSDAYDEYWYSPEVKSWVKAKGASAAGEYEEELISYRVR